MTTQMYIATIAWLLLTYGFLKRKEKRIHVFLMLSGISLDILLVLYLQATRGAIQTALSFSLALLKQLHIGVSTSALLLYFPVVYFGIKLLKGIEVDRIKPLHVKLAVTTYVLRTIGFLFMFSMWKK